MKTPARYLIITSLLLGPMLATEAYSAPHEGRIHSASTSQLVTQRDSRSQHQKQSQVQQLAHNYRADRYLSPRERRILSRKAIKLKHHKKHRHYGDSYRVGPDYWRRDHYRYYRHDRRPYGHSSGAIIFRW